MNAQLESGELMISYSVRITLSLINRLKNLGERQSGSGWWHVRCEILPRTRKGDTNGTARPNSTFSFWITLLYCYSNLQRRKLVFATPDCP